MHDVTKNERELTKNMALAVEKNDHSLLFACVIVENGAKAVERWIGLERLRSSLAFSLVSQNATAARAAIVYFVAPMTNGHNLDPKWDICVALLVFEFLLVHISAKAQYPSPLRIYIALADCGTRLSV